MKRAVRSDDGVSDGMTEQLELLSAMLAESYAASYKDSSLKVRRRFRRLLSGLEAERAQRELSPALALKARPSVGLNR